jgi:hypothetical protein
MTSRTKGVKKNLAPSRGYKKRASQKEKNRSSKWLLPEKMGFGVPRRPLWDRDQARCGGAVFAKKEYPDIF